MQKLLILASNPRRDLNLDREVSDLNNSVRRVGDLEVVLGLGVRAQELQELLAEHSPQYVHFCGHGAGEEGLVFQNDQGREQLVSTEILARIFKNFANEVSCTVLNACESDRQAQVIVEHISYVVGTNEPILDRAAYLFSVAFYKGLAAGKTVEQAYEMGCTAIQIWGEQDTQTTQSRKFNVVGEVQPAMPSLPEHRKPVLLKKGASSTTRSSQIQEAPQPPIPLHPPQDFVEFIHQEIDRKEYKDHSRKAYDNFGQYSAQNAASPDKSEYEQRKILVDKVKQFWIEGFLKSSLQEFTTVRLDLKARADAIADLTEGIEALSVELDESYEQLRDTQTYDEIGQGRTLLILGEPGVGKTIALLQLAQRLVERSEQNLSLPMPVVFNLSSWAKERKALIDWLVDELREKYQVPESLSKSWITQQQLILLLDGLDEVNRDHRDECVRALNEFIGLFPQTEIAICSRVKDYEALSERLQISSALCLQPFSSKQIYQFLDKVGGSLMGLKTLLKNDKSIEKLARNSLILNLMSVAYQGWSVKDLLAQLGSPSNRLQHIFNTYIDRRLARGTASDYSRDDILRWLSCLASRMVEEKQTVFLIEKMQPSWLQSRREKRFYRLVSRMIGESTTEISPLEQLNWFWQRVKARVVREVIIGVISGLIFWLIGGVVIGGIAWILTGSSSWLWKGFISGLIFGLIFGFIFGLGSGIGSTEIKQRVVPNQGIRQSWRNCLVIGLCGGLISGIMSQIVFDLTGSRPIAGLPGGLFFGLIAALIAGLRYGGAACIQHITLRRILYKKGRVPWNYAKFLDFASERLLMKKVGGGYIFFHRMLLEHFAQMKL